MAKKKNPSKVSQDKDRQSESSTKLPGWPGYRTRPGRSGYDPVDTRSEAGHTAGTIIHKLITGRSRNPVYLFFLGILGLVLIAPFFLTIQETVHGNLLPWQAWLFVLITGIAGIAILVNLVRNLTGR